MSRAKTYEVRWAQVAARDLEEIAAFIARDDVEAALSVIDELERAASALRSMPLRGRVPPELERFEVGSYRELIRGPHRIIYRVEGRRVLVLAVLDGRRDLELALLARILASSKSRM